MTEELYVLVPVGPEQRLKFLPFTKPFADPWKKVVHLLIQHYKCGKVLIY